jgi:Hemerythrin HHE cation binding domain
MTVDAAPTERPEEQGWALRRLLGLHAAMRNDLAVLRRAVAAVSEDGQDVDRAVAAIAELSIVEPGWSLRSFCGNFCRFVHDHHSVEDSVMFPSVLQFSDDPEGIREVVDRLMADHRGLGGYLDEVERALAALPGDQGTRAAADKAMGRLSEYLEAHLRFEERSLAPALNAVSRKVSPDEVDAPEPPGGFPEPP